MNWIQEINQEGFAYIYKRISNFISYPYWYMFTAIMMAFATISMIVSSVMSFKYGSNPMFVNKVLIYIFLLIDMLMLYTAKDIEGKDLYVNKDASQFATKMNGKFLFNILIATSILVVYISKIHALCCVSWINCLSYWIKNIIPIQGFIRLFVYIFDFYYLVIHQHKSMQTYRNGNILKFITIKNTIEVYHRSEERRVGKEC